jgi:hypothetical protein
MWLNCARARRPGCPLRPEERPAVAGASMLTFCIPCGMHLARGYRLVFYLLCFLVFHALQGIGCSGATAADAHVYGGCTF